MAKLEDVIQRGTNAARPAATAVAVGTLYYDTTNSSLARSNGTSWESVEGSGGFSNPMTTQGDIITGGASGAAARLAIGTAGQVLTVNAGATAAEWAAAAGGGGVTHTYVGYNTVGGTDEAFTTNRHYMKKITLAAAGTLVGIEAHIKTTSDAAAMEMRFMLFEDNAGTPRYLLHTTHAGPLFLKPSSGVEAFRWFGVGLSRYLAAGDYWIGFVPSQNTGVIKKDGSGSDRYFTAGGNWSIDAGYNAITTTTDRYSIRASILT